MLFNAVIVYIPRKQTTYLLYEQNMFVCVCDSAIYSLCVCIFASCLPTDGSIVFTLKYKIFFSRMIFYIFYSFIDIETGFIPIMFFFSFHFNRTCKCDQLCSAENTEILDLWLILLDISIITVVYAHTFQLTRRTRIYFCLLTLWSAQILSILNGYFWPS